MKTLMVATAVLLLCTAANAGKPPVVVQTGQAKCWDGDGNLISCSGSGQDGETQVGAPADFQDTGKGTIRDRRTHLVWEKKGTQGMHAYGMTYTWSQAFAYIAQLNSQRFAGASDWRLPTIRELQTLVVFDGRFPAVFPIFAMEGCGAHVADPGISCTAFGSGYWSSTTVAGNPQQAWVVWNEDGRSIGYNKFLPGVVRAVRGGIADE